jgi:hypothetical protein
VDEVLTTLDAQGLVDYRRIQDVAPHEMPGLIRQADIVLDQFALGIYGVMAAQVMAAGRLLILGPLLPEVRAAAEAAADMPLPLVEATTDSLAEEIASLVREPERAVRVAAAGPEFVSRVHDGRLAAQVLTRHLGLRGD